MFLTWIRGSRRSSPTTQAKARPKANSPALEELESRVVPSAATDSFVKSLYLALLHRPADSSGLSNWSGGLSSGQMTAVQVIQGIEGSDEYKNALINDAYLQLLGRPADPQGLASWRGFLSGSGGLKNLIQLEADLVGSAEFYAKAGGTTNGFVTQLYIIILGRVPDPQGLAAFTSSVNGSDGGSRTNAAMNVLQSQEADQNVVNNFYQQILGRPADTQGFNSWVAGLQSGTSVVDTITGFLDSAEFNNDAVNNPNFNPDAVVSPSSQGPVSSSGGPITLTPVANLTVDTASQGSWQDDTSDAEPGTASIVSIMVGPSSGAVNLGGPVGQGDLTGSGTWNGIAATLSNLSTPQRSPGAQTVDSFFATVNGRFVSPDGTQTLTAVAMQFDNAPGGQSARASFFDTQGNFIGNTVNAIDLVRP